MIRFLPLKKVCEKIVDCPHESPEWLDEGIPVIRNFNLVNGTIDLAELYYVDEDTYKRRTKRETPRAGDIIFSREAPIGNCGMIPEGFTCCLGQRLVLLRVNKSICSAEYLLSVLLSDYVKKQINQVSKSGSIVSNFAIADLGELVIPIVDGDDAVASVDSLIRKKILTNNTIIKNLDNIAELVFDYWFVQFDFPDKEGKPYKSSGGKMVWNQDYGQMIPENWDIQTLRGLFNVERGISYSSKDIESENGIPMINLASVDKNRNYRCDKLKYYSGTVPENAMLHEGDMLIACTDLTRERAIIGCPILVPNDGVQYTYSTDMAKISFQSDKLENMFMYMTLRTKWYHSYIKRWASGTTVLHLNLDGLDWYKVCIPPMELQKHYGEIIRNIHLKKSAVLMENAKLEGLKGFILPLLMSSQVKIKE